MLNYLLKDHYLGGDIYYAKRAFAFLALYAALTMAIPNTGGVKANLDTHIMMACFRTVAAHNTFVGWALLAVKTDSCKTKSCFPKASVD